MIWLVVALLSFIFQIATILILEFRRPSKAVAWLMILFIVPVIGFAVYYFVAKEYSRKRKVRRNNRKSADIVRTSRFLQSRVVGCVDEIDQSRQPDRRRLFSLLTSIPNSPITCCNRVDVLTNGAETYGAIKESLELARHHIHIEYYIIRQDRTGLGFQQLLIKKAQEGVKVRLIYDGLGSYHLGSGYLNKLRDAGVEVYCFLPPLFALFDKRINYRNHRKMIIVDGRIGFLGGINVGDEYLGKNPRLGFWRDTHLRIEGDAVYFLQRIFLRDWAFVSGRQLTETRLFPKHECRFDQHAQIVASGPDSHWNSIQEVYFAAITTAQSRIYITTPYFIPDPSIYMALKTAAVSGIDVKIIIPGIADSRIVMWASLSYLEELMDAGVRFYQYQKGFMHAKTFIVDDVLGSVGTANLDMRSFFSNFELNALMFERETIDRLESDFLQDLENSKEIDSERFERRPRLQKAKEVMARLLSPLF